MIDTHHNNVGLENTIVRLLIFNAFSYIIFVQYHLSSDQERDNVVLLLQESGETLASKFTHFIRIMDNLEKEEQDMDLYLTCQR
jgi:hypothetical protein